MATMLNSERTLDLAIASADIAERKSLAEIEAEIHLLQADAMRTFSKGVGRLIVRTLRGLGGFIAAVWDGVAWARTYEQLSLLDDGTLEEMGLRREDLVDHVFNTVYGASSVSTEKALEALPGGKTKSPKPAVETPERRAA